MVPGIAIIGDGAQVVAEPSIGGKEYIRVCHLPAEDCSGPLRLIKRVLTKQATTPGVPGDRPGPPEGRDGRSRLIVPDRSSEGPERMLKDFRSGFLQSDAYSAYDQIHGRGILEVGCMEHARRKFDEAKTTDPPRADAALAWIGRLYQIERQAREQIEEAIKRSTGTRSCSCSWTRRITTSGPGNTSDMLGDSQKRTRGAWWSPSFRLASLSSTRTRRRT